MQKVLVLFMFLIIVLPSFGQGLNDVCWTGTTVYAAGNNGVILRSSNAGSTYSSMTVGSANLRSVYGYQSNAWAVGNSGTYLKSSNNGLNWSSQVAAGGADLNCVYFIDSLTGFITGANGLILKCSDGGNNWISLSSGTIENLTKIKFINSSTGYVIGAGGYFAKTTNAGANWQQVILPAAGKVVSISGHNNSLLLGLDESRILLTSNNGANWSLTDLKIQSKPAVKCVYLRSETSLSLVLESGSIWNSTNSGASFTYGQSPMLSSVSSAVFFESRGFMVSGTHNAVLRSQSAGALWEFPGGTTSNISFQTVLSSGTGSMSANKIVSQNYQSRGVLYACQRNKLMRSLNTGENWSLLSTVPSTEKTCMNLLVSMKDSSKMIVVMSTDSLGSNDTCRVYRTTDYGNTWQQTFRNINDRIGNMITQNPANPDTLYIGVRDSLFKSTDFGLSWQKITTYPFRDWCDIAVSYSDPNIMYSASNGTPSRMHKSTNAGLNWFMIDFISDTAYSEMPCLAISNLNPNMLFHAQYGYSVNQRGLKRSFTQGNSWLFTQFEGTSWAVDISKDDPNLISYGNVSYTPVYISTNSGSAFIATQNAWAEQLFYYDRANLFATIGSTVSKMRVTYNMPVIGIENISAAIPRAFSLEQNYPNPFNPSANIVFNLPVRSYVKLIIYDITGREVTLLVNESLPGGSYKVDWNASGMPSGVYFCRIEANDFTDTKKMILLK